MDFGLGIIILVWNCHKWIIWPKLSLNWRIRLLYQTGNDYFTTLPVSAAAIFKMAAYRIPPTFFGGGPLPNFELNIFIWSELNHKTLVPFPRSQKLFFIPYYRGAFSNRNSNLTKVTSRPTCVAGNHGAARPIFVIWWIDETRDRPKGITWPICCVSSDIIAIIPGILSRGWNSEGQYYGL